MDDDAFSQQKVESQLNATVSAGITPAERPAAGRSGRNRLRESVTPYDFKRPERIGKEQMRALQTLHEGLSRNFAAALSAMLRTIVDVKLMSVDQLTYSEFVIGLESPTCFNLIRAEPLEGSLILDINPTILYPIIDRLLGGGKDAGPLTRRPLTEIELRLVSRITALFLAQLKKAWDFVLDLNLSVERVESNAQLVQVVPPNEVVVLVCFELTLAEVRGMINLCIPFNAIERFSSKLTANCWTGSGRGASTPETREAIGRQLNDARVELVATLAETRITTSDLIALRVGDVITTDKDTHSPLEISVQGITKFLASPGALKGHKAIQVQTQL